MCQISKENINFPESYEQKEFEKENKSKWLLRAGKKSKKYEKIRDADHVT